MRETACDRPRVLIADDYPGMVTALRRLLAVDCDVVGSVGDGAALLEAAARLQPDIVVLDLHMPHVNGYDACRQLARLTPRAKVIVLTAASETEVQEAVRNAGASAFIMKHAIADQLLSAIREVYGRGHD